MPKPSTLPDKERARLSTLRELEILDTPPERAFDDLTRLASLVCETPVALVSLVDAHRLWFKSRVGFALEQTSRDASFCAEAILDHDVLIVEDATKDARFASNPFVTSDPHIRFYAGAPLVTRSGDTVGTLCVLDRVPRSFDAERVEVLRMLARQVVAQLELRQLIEQQRSRVRELEMLQEVAIAILSSLDVSDVLKLVTRHLCSLVPTSRSAVFSYDSATSLLRGIAAWGTDEAPLRSLEVHVDEIPAVERAILAERAVEAQITHPALQALGFSASICSALAVRGEVLGLIVVAEPAPPGERPEGWKDRLNRLVRLAALGLHAARAYEQARIASALGDASRVARELHDEVAQILFTISVEAGELVDEATTPKTHQHAKRIVELSGVAGDQLRAAIGALRSTGAFEGLSPALERFVRESLSVDTPRIEVSVSSELAQASGPRAELLFRACREGLTNSVRHARASRCTVRCELDNGWAVVAVDDDGIGLGPPEPGAHFGLGFLREAFERAGGSVEVRSSTPVGMRLLARLPFKDRFA